MKTRIIILITSAVRALTAWAWTQERETCEGLVKVKELHATEGAMELHIQNNPEVKQWVAHCFAEIVAGAPNYVEMKFDLVARKKSDWEWITVLIRKGNGKTPHQLRAEADAQRNKIARAAKNLICGNGGQIDAENTVDKRDCVMVTRADFDALAELVRDI